MMMPLAPFTSPIEVSKFFSSMTCAPCFNLMDVCA
jgi:hypothetical protein